MAVNMTEAELQRLGFTIDPDNPSQAVPVKADDLPDDSWAFERLMSFGSLAVAESTRLSSEATSLSRRSTLHIFRAGRALSLARNKLPPDQTWGDCLRSHDIPRTSAWEAIQLFERAGCEETVALLTPTEAKHKFEITKPKKSLKEKEVESPSIIPFPSAADGGENCSDECASEDEECLGVEDLESDDDPDEDEEVDAFEAANSIPDELEDGDSPDDEPESVLTVLVNVNAVLKLAGAMPLFEEERNRIEAEVIEAHKLLDEILDDVRFESETI